MIQQAEGTEQDKGLGDSDPGSAHDSEQASLPWSSFEESSPIEHFLAVPRYLATWDWLELFALVLMMAVVLRVVLAVVSGFLKWNARPVTPGWGRHIGLALSWGGEFGDSSMKERRVSRGFSGTDSREFARVG